MRLSKRKDIFLLISNMQLKCLLEGTTFSNCIGLLKEGPSFNKPMQFLKVVLSSKHFDYILLINGETS